MFHEGCGSGSNWLGFEPTQRCCFTVDRTEYHEVDSYSDTDEDPEDLEMRFMFSRTRLLGGGRRQLHPLDLKLAVIGKRKSNSWVIYLEVLDPNYFLHFTDNFLKIRKLKNFGTVHNFLKAFRVFNVFCRLKKMLTFSVRRG